MRAVSCDHCDAAFLDADEQPCTACGRGTLGDGAELSVGEPEAYVPDRLEVDGVLAALEHHLARGRYRPSDLRIDHLKQRLVRTWWPEWLVDGHVVGRFSARVGADYEVQSSREVLRDGRWTTEPHIDTRIRWSDRIGRVDCTVDNVLVGALRDRRRWAQRLGSGLSERRPEPWGTGQPGLVRLPERGVDEVRPDAVAALRTMCARRVKEALGADHIDDFVLRSNLDDGAALHHTWLLAPVYTTWYRDDADELHMLWVHGATGRSWGAVMASPRKGWLWAALWAVLAALLLGASVVVGLIGIVLWPLLAAALVGGALGVFLLLVALWPPLAVWRHNRAERAVHDG